MELFGIEFAPLSIPLQRRLQTLGIAISSWLVIVLPFASIAISVYLCFTKYWWIVPLYMAWIYLDKDTPEEGGRINSWIRSWKIFQYSKDYFPVSIHTEPGFALNPKENYLCGYHPHGFMPIGVPVGITAGYGDAFLNHSLHCMTISGSFYIPFFRDFILSLGMCKASPKSISNLLGNKEGGKVLLLPVGGSREALMFNSGEHKIILKNRKGFIKIALKSGCSVIPIFAFGENDTWKQIKFNEGSFMRRFQEWVRKMINVSLVVPVGRGIFQYSYGVLPFRKPIDIVVGMPISIGRNENPTQDEIDAAHKMYIEGLTSIFEAYKHKFVSNPEQCKLILE